MNSIPREEEPEEAHFGYFDLPQQVLIESWRDFFASGRVSFRKLLPSLSPLQWFKNRGNRSPGSHLLMSGTSPFITAHECDTFGDFFRIVLLQHRARRGQIRVHHEILV